MEHSPVENSQHSMDSAIDADLHVEDRVSHVTNHEDTESTLDITLEEVLSIMEVIAATGKYWHDWDILKALLSFRLRQVLSEYPEAQPFSGDGPQLSSLSGETYAELVRRLDEALLSFIEGPPFTLQRLCEILLDPKSTYRSLSKLALALEKNLLVTSTLTISSEPYPKAVSPKSSEPERATVESQVHPVPASNGSETMSDDGDEEMVDAAADEDAPSANTEADVAAQVVDTEVHDAQVADADVDNAQVAEPEPENGQNVDTEMGEEKTGKAPESSPDQVADSESKSTESSPDQIANSESRSTESSHDKIRDSEPTNSVEEPSPPATEQP